MYNTECPQRVRMMAMWTPVQKTWLQVKCLIIRWTEQPSWTAFSTRQPACVGAPEILETIWQLLGKRQGNRVRGSNCSSRRIQTLTEHSSQPQKLKCIYIYFITFFLITLAVWEEWHSLEKIFTPKNSLIFILKKSNYKIAYFFFMRSNLCAGKYLIACKGWGE